MVNSPKPLAFLLSSAFADKYPHKLAAGFPHVMHRLEEYWNDADALTEYFSELMVSKRPGRRGFPPEVGAEILTLSLAYDRIGPIKPAEQERASVRNALTDDVWGYERAIAELERLNIPRTMAGFARAVEAGDEHVCRLFLHAGFDVNARDTREWTPLMIASFNGRETLAIELIKLGASVHAQDADGYTPLHWGTFNGHAKVVQLLLRKGAEVNAVSRANITALVQAAARGHAAIVQLLLQHRANVNITARDGSTALLKAVANGHWQVINMLLDAGASTKVTMQNGITLAAIAAHSRDPRIRERIAIAIRMERAGHAPLAGDDPLP
ncbi:MAG TPA: ankyrin repeat domain-containing protein [Rhodocyclaceae bacterium]|nr:ankyrin repeat domain-containing protein [Rhodocyclaceae bacterium]